MEVPWKVEVLALSLPLPVVDIVWQWQKMLAYIAAPGIDPGLPALPAWIVLPVAVQSRRHFQHHCTHHNVEPPRFLTGMVWQEERGVGLLAVAWQSGSQYRIQLTLMMRTLLQPNPTQKQGS